MSIPNKNIDGDVSIGRNVNIGSNAVVRGCVTVGHNLKVEGWLDAPNLKGACKGYFLSLADLQAAYPSPTNGDYAFVGENGLPGPIYIAEGGVWKDSGKTGGPSLDIGDIDDLTKEVAECVGSIDVIDKAQEKLRADFDAHITTAATELAAVKATAEASAADAAAAKQQAAAAEQAANAASATAAEAKSAAEAASGKAAEAKAAADNAGTTAAAAAGSAAAAAETAAGAVTAINTLKTENTADHAAIRKEASDALAAHAAANDKAFADEASARKAVSEALAAHETADTADHAAIRKKASDALASAVTAQHDTLACSGVVAFDGFVGDVSGDGEGVRSAPIVRDPEGKVQQGAATVHYDTANGCWAIKQDGAYYDAWDDDYLWQDAQQVPRAGKAYYNVRDGKLYRYSSTDNQLHELALTQLRDDVGILPCRVRTAAPLMPMEGAPTTAAAYTIWWSQTSKKFFAAIDYNEETVGDSIENCDAYELKYCDEYTDYCTVRGSGETQTAEPRTDRIYRSGNKLWRYDKTTGTMIDVSDISGGTYDSVQLTGYSQAETLDVQHLGAEDAQAEMLSFKINDESAGLENTVRMQAQARGMSVDWETAYKTKRVMTLENMRDEMIYQDGQETLTLGDDDSPLNVTGVRTLEAESIKTTGGIAVQGKTSIMNLECADATLSGDVDITGILEVGNGATVQNGLTVDNSDITVVGGDIHVQGEAELGSVKTTGNINSSGRVSGLVVHGDSATFCQGEEVKIDVNGNISTEGTLTVQGAAAFGEVTAESIEVGEGGSIDLVEGATLSSDNLNGVFLDGRINFVFHGIRQALPTGYTAVTDIVKPKTYTDGVYEYDIVYIRALKRFVCVNDTAKTYAERFNGEGEYNVIANNKPTTARTDRTWQWGADTYKYDTEAYISKYRGLGKDEYGADLVCVTDAGKALFIKMWREAICRPLTVAASTGMVVWDSATDELGNIPISDYGGYYPEWHETPGFFINGINGISYAEARQIFEARTYGSYPRQLRDVGNIRTNMLCCYNYNTGGGQDGRGINTPFAFVGYGTTVVRVAAGLRGQRPTGSCWLRGSLNFYDVPNLVEVIGAVQLGTPGDNALSFLAAPFPKLQYLWISDLSVSLTKTFAGTPNINVDCLRYLVEKSKATAAKPISVTLHADVFAALPEDILTLAETKYVTFVSA